MVRGDDGVAQPGIDLGVGLYLVAGIGLRPAERVERFLVGELARELKTFAQPPRGCT